MTRADEPVHLGCLQTTLLARGLTRRQSLLGICSFNSMPIHRVACVAWLAYATSFFGKETSPPPTPRAQNHLRRNASHRSTFFSWRRCCIYNIVPGGKTVKTDAFLPKTRSHAPIAKEKMPAGRPTNRRREVRSLRGSGCASQLH
jgi:hypothetical protein